MTVDTQLTLYKPQWPLKNFTVHEFGRYGAKRTSAKEGACGKAGFPCTHWGVDLSAPEGTDVFVPFNGHVLYYGPADKAPFIGYGPWVALIAHADRDTPVLQLVKEWATGPLVDIFDLPEGAMSVRYSLIGHLARPPGIAPPGTGIEITYEEPSATMMPLPSSPVVPHVLVGDIWDAAKAKPDPDHWRPQKNGKQNVVMYTGADGNTLGRVCYAGQSLGKVSDKNHVHWELRTSPVAPAASGTWRIDPIGVFTENYQVPLPAGSGLVPVVDEEESTGGGGGGLLLLIAAFLFGSKKKRGHR